MWIAGAHRSGIARDVGDFLRGELSVGVDGHKDVVAARERALNGGLKSDAEAAIRPVPSDLCARSASDVCGSVGRPVIDHEYVDDTYAGDGAGNALDHQREGLGLILARGWRRAFVPPFPLDFRDRALRDCAAACCRRA